MDEHTMQWVANLVTSTAPILGGVWLLASRIARVEADVKSLRVDLESHRQDSKEKLETKQDKPAEGTVNADVARIESRLVLVENAIGQRH